MIPNFKVMITVDQAKQLIFETIKVGPKFSQPISTCLGYISAGSILSPMDSPPFAQSAMDGFAFCFSDLQVRTQFELQGVIQAGDTNLYQVEEGKCFRIFTGAPIPSRADTVIMQEYCDIQGNSIEFVDASIVSGANVRALGSQIKVREQLLKEGIELTPGIIGYLATLGITKVEVYAKPRINILITGNELVKAGINLKFGEIYESNSIMLQMALKELGIEVANIFFSNDDLHNTIEAVKDGLQDTDMLLITGGISVGEFDFVQKALESNQVSKVFYKVKQKPGKPLYFGVKDNVAVYALPGNPSSVLTCFYEYVVPAIRNYCGKTFAKSSKLKRPLLHDYYKKGELTHFLKGLLSRDGVTILDGQESYKLNSFTMANCLVVIEGERNEILKGEFVEVQMLKEMWID